MVFYTHNFDCHGKIIFIKRYTSYTRSNIWPCSFIGKNKTKQTNKQTEKNGIK